MTRNTIGTLAVPAGVVAIVAMIFVPLPTPVIDLLIATNIGAAVVILLMSMNVRRPLDFSVFPSLILVMTLFRLALNISSTRNVLLQGYAGQVIDAFGHFVIGGSMVVVLTIFLILIEIQFIVVTNGASRVAEVGARFTLDAMPGKQMAIDADLNAGLIDEIQARQRRADITAEADFYGAMDGATKFVKGDAVAAVIITIINLLGGFTIGILQRGLGAGEAANTYSLLTIGDGLVSAIPALLLSVATGLIVTRSTTDSQMGNDILAQFSQHKGALQITGFAMIALCLVPGLPKLPFLVLGGVFLTLASRAMDSNAIAAAAEPPPLPEDKPDSPEAIAKDMAVDPLALEVAFDLVDLVDPARGGDLLDRIRALRRKVAMELGVLIPLVRTRDDLDLPSGTYVIRLAGVPVARGSAPVGRVLAIGDGLEGIPGEPTREPVFGLAAMWVPIEFRQQAEIAGATVVDRASIITTHLSEVARRNAARLLTREDVRSLVEIVKRQNPAVVDELTPSQLSLGEIQRVLQGLLEDGVAIRDLARIFEALSLRAKATTDPEALLEAARLALGPAIAAAVAQGDLLRVIALDPGLERYLMESVRVGESGPVLAMEPHRAQALVDEIVSVVTAAEAFGSTPAVVCSGSVRGPLRRLLRTAIDRVPVLAYGELGGTLRVETLGVVSGAATAAL